MRTLGGWLIILAVGAGMYYAYYVTQASGSSIGEYPLEVEGGVHQLEIGPIELSPDMNPIRALWHFEVSSSVTRRDILGYELALHDASGDTVWQEEGSHRKSEDKTSNVTKSLTNAGDVFDVEQAGEYSLEASVRTIGSSVNLEEASLELRRNVAGFSPLLLAGLGGIALLGLILAVVGRKKPE